MPSGNSRERGDALTPAPLSAIPPKADMSPRLTSAPLAYLVLPRPARTRQLKSSNADSSVLGHAIRLPFAPRKSP